MVPHLQRRKIEEQWAVWFDGEDRVLGKDLIARGGIGACDYSTHELVRAGAKANAFACVMLHNHPDAVDAIPSVADAVADKQTSRALDAANIDCVDSLVVSRTGQWASTFAMMRASRIKRRKR